MAISPDLFRAILAMAAYNRGYNAGIKSENAGKAGFPSPRLRLGRE
jgi:hypothetical protein